MGASANTMDPLSSSFKLNLFRGLSFPLYFKLSIQCILKKKFLFSYKKVHLFWKWNFNMSILLFFFFVTYSILSYFISDVKEVFYFIHNAATKINTCLLCRHYLEQSLVCFFIFTRCRFLTVNTTNTVYLVRKVPPILYLFYY